MHRGRTLGVLGAVLFPAVGASSAAPVQERGPAPAAADSGAWAELLPREAGSPDGDPETVRWQLGRIPRLPRSAFAGGSTAARTRGVQYPCATLREEFSMAT